MAEEIVFKLELDDSGAVKNLEELAKALEEIQKNQRKAEKGAKGFGDTIKNLGKAAGIVGLLVTAFEILKETLFSNQTVVDAVNTATTALKIVFNDLWEFVTNDLTPALKSVFEAPQEALDAVKKGITDFVDRQLKLLFDGLGLFGKAFDKLLTGDIKGALLDAGEGFVDIQRAINPLVIVTEAAVKGTIAATDAIIEYGKETITSAKAIDEAVKSSRMLELQQTRLREAADRDAERQRQIRDDYTKNIDDRIAANDKLAIVLDEQERLEKATVQARIDALQREQEQLGVTQERREEIYALNTELAAIEAQQEGFRSEQQINAINLQKEKIELMGFQTQAELDAYLKEKEIKDQAAEDEKKRKAEAKKQSEEDAKKQEALDKQIANNKVDLAIGAANAIQAFTEEGSELGKAAAIAATVIDTIRGAQSAFTNTVGGIAIKLGAAAVATAIGIANVKKIVGTKIPGGGATSAPNISNTAAVAPPNFDIEQTNQNQLADTINSTNGNPIKAYVVGSEVTSQQQMDRIETANATL